MQRYAFFWGLVLFMAAAYYVEAGAGKSRSLGTTWNPALPMFAGVFFNLTLQGFDDYTTVMVFMEDVDQPDLFVKYDMSGVLGYLQAQAPDFAPGTEVQFTAVGIPAFGEQHDPADGRAIAQDPNIYLFSDSQTDGELFLAERAPYGRRKFARAGASVSILGRPSIIHVGTFITVLWSGFDSGAYVQVQLVCPVGSHIVQCVPAYREYVFFMPENLLVMPQIGCFVQALQGTVDMTSGQCTIDPATTVVGQNFVLMS